MTSSHKQCNMFLLTTLLLFISAKGYFFYGNELRDLESNTSYFPTEIKDWNLTGRLTTANFSQCGGTWLLGGFGIVGDGGSFAKKYTSLPPHNTIYFSMDAYLIDLQELSDLFKIYFDSTLASTWGVSLFASFFTTNPASQVCGGSRQDYTSINIKGKVAHNSSSLTFKIVSLYNSASNNFSLGFRNLNLQFKITSTTSTSACAISDTLGLSSSCLCSKGQYDVAGLLGCSSCNGNCETCLGSAATDCTSCAAGHSFNGTTCLQCHSTCYQCKGTAATDCVRCASGKYLYWNGTCQSTCPSPLVNSTVGTDLYCNLPCGSNYLYEDNTCNSTCTTPTPFVSSTSIISSSLKLCNFTCSSSSQYLDWNNTCRTGCASPLINVTQGVERYCKVPCSGSQVYSLKDSACQASCQYPYVQKTNGDYFYCDFKCNSSQYLYWNGTCQSTCPTSYTVINGTEKYCNKYCPTNQFLFSSTTSACISSCDPPLVQTVDTESYKTCSLPCTSGKYLYPDYSCQSSCAYNSSTNSDGVLLCTYPCAQNSFLYEDNTCNSNCSSPYVQVTINANLSLCNSPCASNKLYLPSTSSCVTQCDSPLVAMQNGTLKYCGNASSGGTPINTTNATNTTNPTNTSNTSNNTNTNETSTAENTLHYSSGGMETFAQIVGNAGDILRKNNPHSGFIYVLVKLVKCVTYMNVPLHKDVLEIINTNSSALKISISDIFTYQMPSNFQKQFTERRLTEKYERQSDHATYVVNHWENLLLYLILLVLGLIFTNVEKLVMKFSKRRTLILIIKRLRIITRWNFLLFVLFNTYDDLTLFAAFEFKNGIQSEAFPIVFSFLLCIALSCFAFYLLGKALWIAKQALKTKEQLVDDKSAVVSPDVLFYKKWEDYQIVFAGYKNTSFMSQTFLFWFTCRIIITYLFVAFLESSPLIQSLVFTLLSVLMLTYLIKVRPFKEKFSFFVNIIFEILLLIMNTSLLLLCAASSSDSLSFQSQYGLSLAVLMMYLLIEVLGNVFAWTYVILTMWGAYKAAKTHGLSGKTSWLNILVAPYKNPGLSFSELSNHEFVKPGQLDQLDVPVRAQRKKTSWIDKVSTSVAARLRIRKINGRIVPINYQLQDQEVEDKSTLPDKSAEYQKLNSIPKLPGGQDDKSRVDLEVGESQTTPRLVAASSSMSPLHLPEPLSLKQEPPSPLGSSSTLNTMRKSSFGLQSQGLQSNKGPKSTDNLNVKSRRKSLFGSPELDSTGLKAMRHGSDNLAFARNVSDAVSFIVEEENEDSPAKMPGKKAFAFANDESPALTLARNESVNEDHEGEPSTPGLYDHTPSTPSNWLLKRSFNRKGNFDKSGSSPLNLFNSDNTPLSTKSLIKDINSRAKLFPDADAETPGHKDLFSPNSSFMSAGDESRRNHRSIIGDLFAQPKKIDLSKEWATEKIAEFRRNSHAVFPQNHFS